AVACSAMPARSQDLIGGTLHGHGQGKAAQQVDHFGEPVLAGAKLRLGDVRLRHAGTVNGVAFSPDGKQLASCAWENAIRLWDVATGKQVQRLATGDDEAGHFAIAFSPRGDKLAAVGERGHVRLWDLKTG